MGSVVSGGGGSCGGGSNKTMCEWGISKVIIELALEPFRSERMAPHTDKHRHPLVQAKQRIHYEAHCFDISKRGKANRDEAMASLLLCLAESVMYL